jgi:Asp/Glu/hydantoin racemase
MRRMHKVLVIVPFPMNEEQLALRRSQTQAVRLGPDIEFDFRPVKAAPSHYVSHHDYILADTGILEEVARKAIEEDGADVILLGSTTMHQSHAWLAERLPVPVINPGPLTYKLAELALGLGLKHSRKAYPKPLVAKPELFEAMLAAAAAAAAKK